MIDWNPLQILEKTEHSCFVFAKADITDSLQNVSKLLCIPGDSLRLNGIQITRNIHDE